MEQEGGVPHWSWPATLVPCSIRNCAILRWPSKNTKWGGVDLRWSWPAASAPRLTRNCAILRWPSKDAKWVSIDPCWSWPATLVLRSTRNRAISIWPSKDAKWVESTHVLACHIGAMLDKELCDVDMAIEGHQMGGVNPHPGLPHWHHA